MTHTADPARIIVGVDGSDSSIEAIQHAASLAQLMGTPLEAITTWSYAIVLEPYYPINNWSPEEDAASTLATAVDRAFHGKPPMDIAQTVIQGPAAKVLIEESAHAAMLVLGSRGHGGFVGLLLGSVSAACAEHARCPVLIVHGSKPSPRNDDM